MFRNVVSSTALTRDAADNYFKDRIFGESYRGDNSFIATLRALVTPRMHENDILYLQLSASSYGKDMLDGLNAKRTIRDMFYYFDGTCDNRIVIHEFKNRNNDANIAWMSFMKENFCKAFDGWSLLTKVTDFFHKSFQTVCFIHPENKSVMLFVESLDMRKYHYLQCAVFALFPWYFNPKDGVSSLEMRLIESLRQPEVEVYLECINEIASQYDFRSINIRSLLAGFETKYEKQQIDTERRRISDLITKINLLNEELGSILAKKRESEDFLLGLETKVASAGEDSEIMDYFLHNKNLELVEVNDTSITFVVKSYIEYFDENMAERMINNPASYIYNDSRTTSISADDMKVLMTEIFLNQTLRIKVCAAYRFELMGNVTGLSNYQNYNQCGCEKYTPNPHIDGYSCLGNHSRVINELLSKYDYIGAIEQSSASCQSLNFGDSTVMSTFMSRLYGRDNRINIRCIELPTGEVVEPDDAVAWIKSQEVTEE